MNRAIGSFLAVALLTLVGLGLARADKKRPPVLPPANVDWAKTYEPKDSKQKPKLAQKTIVVIGASAFNHRMEEEHGRGWRVVPGTLDLETSHVGASDAATIVAVTLERQG